MTYKLNLSKEHFDGWLAALRSGDYKQGTGNLHTEEKGVHSYCCLGVLCEVQQIRKIAYTSHDADRTAYAYGDEGEGKLAYYPGNLAVPPPWENDVTVELMHLNDNKKRSFNEIADWIEDKCEAVL